MCFYVYTYMRYIYIYNWNHQHQNFSLPSLEWYNHSQRSTVSSHAVSASHNNAKAARWSGLPGTCRWPEQWKQRCEPNRGSRDGRRRVSKTQEWTVWTSKSHASLAHWTNLPWTFCSAATQQAHLRHSALEQRRLLSRHVHLYRALLYRSRWLKS